MGLATKKHFRCRDVGCDCTWGLEGDSEEQMLPIIEAHALKVHNLTHFKGPAVDRVIEAIRRNG